MVSNYTAKPAKNELLNNLKLTSLACKKVMLLLARFRLNRKYIQPSRDIWSLLGGSWFSNIQPFLGA